jgi:tripartite-type tricarboxylate transporter receptor subunit TctC
MTRNLGITLFVAIFASTGTATAAEQYPTKPIRLLVPFPPGAASDFLARVVGQQLADLYGQQVVIDNRPGAGGLIGSQIVAKSNPDGYTLGMVGQPHLSNVLIREPRPYDPIRDFNSVGLVAVLPNVVVVGNSVPAKNLSELIALARSKPGQLNFGSAGTGSSSHLAGEMFVAAAGIKAVHVPFKLFSDVFAEMIQGRIQFYVFPLPAAMPMLKDTRLKAVAVGTPKRAVALPGVPTAREAGMANYESESWFGIVGPAGMPKAVIAKLNADIVRTLQKPEVRQRFENQGAEPRFGTPGQFDKLQRDEYPRLAKLIKELGIRVQ